MAKTLDELKQEITDVSAVLETAATDKAAFDTELTTTQGLQVKAETSRQAALEAAKVVIADFTAYAAESSPVVITPPAV